MKMSRALGLSFLWVILALTFNAFIYFEQGAHKAAEFLAGYLIELSLSVDNIFVFLLIFSYFKMPSRQQSKVLYWGVLGAQLMRAVFILGGIALLNKFQWLTYVLGVFLVLTGVHLFKEKDKGVQPDQNPVFKFCSRCFPNLGLFWIVLIVIETFDLIFALDSIPAVLAITKDPFIVFTSNIFAVLGLRTMYFALAKVMPLFHHLHYALGVILVFIGFKMAFERYIYISTAHSLMFIALVLTVFIATSLLFKQSKRPI